MALEQLVNLLSKENITLLIALWGAVLSTYKVISDNRKNARRVRVTLSHGFISQGNDVGPLMLMLSAANIGNREVTLNSMGYIMPDGKRSITIEPQSNVSFPYVLSEGKSCTVWKVRRQFASELKRNGYSGKIEIRGYFGSATGETYKSKPP